MSARSLVLDTNIVLDLFVFRDPAALPVLAQLQSARLLWLATQPMRDELERVLGYPQIVPRLAFYGLPPQEVLQGFDTHARIVPVPARADIRCKDEDDQKFVDLAVAHGSLLLSKDRALLCMARRFSARGAAVTRQWTSQAA